MVLKDWNKNQFGNIHSRVKAAMTNLANIQQQNPNIDFELLEEIHAQIALDNALHIRDLF